MSAPAEDVNLPMSVISKLISSTLGPDIVVSDDAKHIIHECAKELIQLLASESNEQMKQAGKSNMMPVHLIAALQELDYTAWIPSVSAVSEEDASEKKSHVSIQTKYKRKLAQSGKSTEELQAIQQEKFRQAKLKMEQQTTAEQLESKTKKQKLEHAATSSSGAL